MATSQSQVQDGFSSHVKAPSADKSFVLNLEIFAL